MARSFTEADSTHVPVNIWLDKKDQNKWLLTADCYDVRREIIENDEWGMFHHVGSLIQCQELLALHVLPIYRNAVYTIGRMASLEDQEPIPKLHRWEL